jgi:hypothetical protein
MLASINPVVYRGSIRRTLTCRLMHLAGGGIAGACLAALLASLAPWAQVRHGVGIDAAGAGLAGLAFVQDTGLLPWRTPSPNRQVPKRWRYQLRPQWCAFAYGAGLGLAFGTRVRFAVVYLIFGVAMLMMTTPEAAVIGAVFGIARSSIVLAGIGASSPERLDRRIQIISAAEPVAKALALLASGTVLAILLALALTGS